MEHFFTEAFSKMDACQQECFYRTVFMNDPSEYAAELRRQYYADKLKFMGKNVYIGVGVKLVNPQYISLGNNVHIDDHATLIARGKKGIALADDVRLNDRVYLDTECTDTGYIQIGQSAYIGTGTTLFGHRGLEIGEHALLAQNITVTPYSHIYTDPVTNIIDQGGHCKKVTIGRDCYIGMGVCVMYSGDIGEGSVIGAGSVVIDPIPPFSIAVGTPARVIKMRDGNG